MPREVEYLLDNWVQQLKMECASKEETDIMNISFLVGWCLSLVYGGRVGDEYGRKKIYLIALCFQIPVYIGVIFAKSIQFMTLMLAFSGAINGIRQTIGFIYMMEFIQEKHQIAIATVMFACEALTYLYGPFYF